MSTTINTPALTLEELNWHKDFVYRRVMNNTVLQTQGKFVREQKLTIQDLVHSNVSTLQQIGRQIEQVSQQMGASRFGTDGPFKINGVEATNWITFLELQIKLAKAEEDEKRVKAEIKKLEEEYEGLKSDDEKKEDIRKKLAALKGEAPGVPSLPVVS